MPKGIEIMLAPLSTVDSIALTMLSLDPSFWPSTLPINAVFTFRSDLCVDFVDLSGQSRGSRFHCVC